MFVCTVDQIASRSHADRVDEAAAQLRREFGTALLLGPDRTAGDEFQLIVADAADALEVALALVRDGGWSIGLGVGDVELPLPATTREGRGGAFSAARDAVDRAKRAQHHLAVTGADRDAADVEALLTLLLEVRDRRTPEGWQVADLLRRGATQVEAAAALGVTPQAVSLRARTAGLRVDARAVPALARLLAALDTAPPRPDPEGVRGSQLRLGASEAPA